MKLPNFHDPKVQLGAAGAVAVAGFALYKKRAAGASSSAQTGTVAADGTVTDPTAADAFGSATLENAIVGDLQPQIDALGQQVAGIKATAPVPAPPRPQGPPGTQYPAGPWKGTITPTPAPKAAPGAGTPINAAAYAQQIPLNNTPANEALTVLGSIGVGGKFTGHNVTGGAPVYAEIPQFGVAIQGFNAKTLPPGTKLATLKSFAARIDPRVQTEQL